MDEFEYLGFASTAGLSLNNGIAKDSRDFLKLTELSVTSDVNGVFLTAPQRFDEDWLMMFRVEVGPETSTFLREDGTRFQADGWAIVWATSSTYIGGNGRDVGYFNGSGVANTRGLAFRLWSNLDLIWSVGGAFTNRRTGKDWRGDRYYWLDYDSASQTLSVYTSTTSTQPSTPSEVFTSVSFGTTEWYLGMTASTGSATMNSFLKEWSLETNGHGWGITLS